MNASGFFLSKNGQGVNPGGSLTPRRRKVPQAALIDDGGCRFTVLANILRILNLAPDPVEGVPYEYIKAVFELVSHDRPSHARIRSSGSEGDEDRWKEGECEELLFPLLIRVAAVANAGPDEPPKDPAPLRPAEEA